MALVSNPGSGSAGNMGCCTLAGSITVQPGCRTHAGPLSPALSSPPCLYIAHCTVPRWVHFWWDDSNGLVAHSAEGQKRPQAAACTMGRAITHCTLHNTAHASWTQWTSWALQKLATAKQGTQCSVHAAHLSVLCTQLRELPTHKANIAHGAELLITGCILHTECITH